MTKHTGEKFHKFLWIFDELQSFLTNVLNNGFLQHFSADEKKLLINEP